MAAAPSAKRAAAACGVVGVSLSPLRSRSRPLSSSLSSSSFCLAASSKRPLQLGRPAVGTTTGMHYGLVAGLAKRVSRVVFGTLFLHQTKAPHMLLDTVWAAGCNAFDCARIYGGGDCERILGEWLRSRRVPREEVVLVTKGGCSGQDKQWAADLSPSKLRADLGQSLHSLGVDHVDVYMLHRDCLELPVAEIVKTMATLHAEGHFTVWGVSNWRLDRLQAAIAHAEAAGLPVPVCNSVQFSLAAPSKAVWPGTTYLSAGSRQAAWYAQSGVAVLAWECLAKGFMAGRWSRDSAPMPRSSAPAGSRGLQWREKRLVDAYCVARNFDRRDRAAALARARGVSMVEVALKYVASQPFSSFVLVGTTKPHHFSDNVRAGVGSMFGPAEIAWLEDGRGAMPSSGGGACAASSKKLLGGVPGREHKRRRVCGYDLGEAK